MESTPARPTTARCDLVRRMVLGRLGVGLGVAVAVMGAWVTTTPGWACVPQPLLVVGPVSSAPPGAKATVNGFNFSTGRSEVRWNGLEGPLLGTANGSDFSMEVTVPDVAPGLYVMVGLVRVRDGSVGETSAASFQVTGPDNAAPSGPGAPRTQRSDEQATNTASSGLSWPAAAGGAVVVFALGTVVASLARRRRGPSPTASS